MTDSPADNATTTISMFNEIGFQIGKLAPILTVVICIILALFMILSIIGNGLTCLVIKRSRRLQSTTNYFIFALAVNGLVISSIVPFLMVSTINGSWIFPDWLCRVFGVLVTACLGCDMFLLVGIALDRYYIIIYPLSFKITLKRSCKMILISFLTAVIISFPSGYFYTTAPIVPMLSESRMRCYVPYGSQKWLFVPAYFTPLICVHYLAPIFILTIIYWRITNFIWTFAKGVGSRIVQRTRNPIPRSKIKTLKVIFIITSVLIFINGIGQILRCADLIPRNVDSIDFIWLALFLVQISSVAKPVICLLYNTSFRRGCREVLCWSRLHCYREELYAVTTVSGLAKRNHISCFPPPIPMPTIFPPKSDGHHPKKAIAESQQLGDTDSDDSSRHCLRRTSVAFDRSNLISNWPVQSNNTFI